MEAVDDVLVDVVILEVEVAAVPVGEVVERHSRWGEAEVEESEASVKVDF